MTENAQIAVGFIGLGNQGAPIAGRIRDAGFALHVWDVRPEAAGPLVASGAHLAASKAELARAAAVVGICVANDDQLRDVMLGDDGLIAHLAPGAVVMIHTTCLPETAIELADAARPHGIAVLDAPVSRGTSDPRQVLFNVMIGGEPEALEKARPVLEAYAARIIPLGEVGRGQVMKLLNNSLFYANLHMAIAALQLAGELGMDQPAAAELISHSSGNSFAMGLLQDPYMFPHTAGDTSLARKDIGHFIRMVAERGLASPLVGICEGTGDAVEAFAPVWLKHLG